MEALQPGDPGKVGHYRLIGRLGEGGMGRVYLGLSPGGRQVAVKLIHPGQAGPQFRERFAREIEAARRVGGFHTAPVVDADPAGDPPWMVTAYIPGPALNEAVLERGPFGLMKARTLGAGLAEGLAAIHACGLVHRDLKPSNVILAEDGPRIIDFGIARAAEASRMTTAGLVVGTYSYMSPEQVAGEVAGPASDVFSLGCTLAFAVTARAPFGDESIVSVVRRISSEPPDLAGVPEEYGFRQLLSECLAKRPDDRPSLDDILGRLTEADDMPTAEPAADAAPISDAMGAVPSADPGHATDVGPVVEAGPFVQAGTDSGLEAGATESSGQRYVPTQAWDPGPQRIGAEPTSGDLPAAAVRREQAGAARRRPRGRMLAAAGVAVVALLAAGLGLLLSSGSPKAHHVAATRTSSRPPSSSPAAAPPTQPARPQLTLHDPKGKNVFQDVFRSNSVIATGDANGSAYVWNVPAGKITTTLRDLGGSGVNGIAYSAHANLFATADSNAEIFIWQADTGQLTATLQNPGRANYSIAFSPDGRLLVAGSQTGRIYLWDVAAGQARSTPDTGLQDPGGKSVYGAAFSPDGRLLATGDTNGKTYLWNVAAGKLTGTFTNPISQGLYDVAFSPDGKLLAVSDSTGDAGGVVYLWDVATGRLVASLYPLDSGNIADIAFSPDGRFLAGADTVGTVMLWNVATHASIAALLTPAKQLIGVAFSPDGNSMAATGTNGNTFVWNMKWLAGSQR
jgi:serine/threonine protein kinase/DNA-binding beta-propeller fold protein YncE